MYKILKNNLCPYWINNLWLVLFIGLITSFNYGGCGVNDVVVGSSSGLSTPVPFLATNPATNITRTSALLNGTVIISNGVITTVYFQWGTTTSYGEYTTPLFIGSGSSDVSVYTVISGLSPNTPYYFRVVATTDIGTTYGDNLTFTTTN
ncbi:MAG: hypothetical protein V1871_04000 [Planctomycetota bacterium]